MKIHICLLELNIEICNGEISLVYDFYDEVMQKYKTEDIFQNVSEVFSSMPLACVLADDVHYSIK